VKTGAIALAWFLLGRVLSAADTPIQVQFKDGCVWVDATNAPVRDVLHEWERLGGATIVNGDAVEGSAITLHLSGVPEGEALDALLRDMGGYIALLPEATSGPSRFGRILLLPRSSPPAAPRPAAQEDSRSGTPDPAIPAQFADIIRTVQEAVPVRR